VKLPQNSPQACGERLINLIKNASKITIIAPFIKREVLKVLLQHISNDHQVSLKIYTRWHAHEVAKGISDTDILDLVKKYDGYIFLHPLLHAKAYITDQGALVGSANTSFQGLGWKSRSALELLIPINNDEPHLKALVEELEKTSSQATLDIYNAINSHASTISTNNETIFCNDNNIDFTDDTNLTLSYDIPVFNAPEIAWLAYIGKREKEIETLVWRDLKSLGVPSGIKNRNTFYAVVSTNLLQGLSGKIIQEIEGLSAIKAANRFAELMSLAGQSVPPDKIEIYYQSFIKWASHFVNDKKIQATAYSLYS